MAAAQLYVQAVVENSKALDRMRMFSEYIDKVRNDRKRPSDEDVQMLEAGVADGENNK